MAVEYVSMDVRVQFGDSRSNRFSDIRATQFVMDDKRRSSHNAERYQAAVRAFPA